MFRSRARGSVGVARGSVLEGVEHGVTGFVCDHVEKAVRRVERLPELDRARGRERSMSRFTHSVVASEYERVDRGTIAGCWEEVA